MSRYLFELYNVSSRGRIFKGFKTVAATSLEEAQSIILEKEEDKENIQLCQLYFNFEE